ncbi:MAG: ParB/RepB/Spo0J family partition protein [Campylobacterota bacterium]|nr:ParB/RepB/Spo0J family partition protein [Campylobacterota bacterium]
MKSQVLGRGLDALFGEIDEAYENESSNQENLIDINLKDIKPNPFQPRKNFNDELLQELADSIKNDGLLQPIIVTENIDGYTIIAGERRYRASKIAKLKTIRAVVLNSDEYKMRQFALIENIQRENLNSIELALAYSELIKLHEVTHEELSSMIHKSRTHITNTIRLLQLSKKTHKSIVDKKITTGHAKVLIGLDDKQQQLIVNSIVGQKLSVREVESIVKSMKENNISIPKKTETVSYDFSNVQNKFNTLGFNSKSLNNKLTIEFSDEKQIEDFLSYFSK